MLAIGEGIICGQYQDRFIVDLLFAEAGKVLGYGSDSSAYPISTQYPFWIWNIDMRSGVDKFFGYEKESRV